MASPIVIHSHVYYVAPNPYTENPIAIRPSVKNHQISWENTSPKSFRKKFAKIRLEPEAPSNAQKPFPKKIEILTDQNDKISLTFLTLKIYETHVKNHVLGTPSFQSDEEVQNYYLTTNFQAY